MLPLLQAERTGKSLGEGVVLVELDEGLEERLVVAVAAAVEDEDVGSLFDVSALRCAHVRLVPVRSCMEV